MTSSKIITVYKSRIGEIKEGKYTTTPFPTYLGKIEATLLAGYTKIQVGASFHLSNRKRFLCLRSLILTREGLGEFETVMQTRNEVEGLHNCLEFSQTLECLYQDMQTQEKISLLLL